MNFIDLVMKLLNNFQLYAIICLIREVYCSKILIFINGIMLLFLTFALSYFYQINHQNSYHS